MPAPRFSLSPTVEPGVRADLERVRDAVVSQTRPRLLLAIGSFGRGEGRARPAPDLPSGGGPAIARPRYDSDLELAAYYGPRPPPGLDSLSRALSAELDWDIKVYATSPLRFWATRGPWPRYRVDRPLRSTVDFWLGHRVLHGRRPDLPRVRAADIPDWEALRLVANRVAEAQRDPAARGKLWLGVMDAWLLRHGSYHVALAARVRALAALARKQPVPAGYVARVERAVAGLREGSPLRASDAAARSAVTTWLRAAGDGAEVGPDAEPLDAVAALFDDPRLGHVHTGPSIGRRAWDRLLRRKAAAAGVRVPEQAPQDGLGLEWRIYEGCLAAYLGEAEARPWLDVWAATLAG